MVWLATEKMQIGQFNQSRGLDAHIFHHHLHPLLKIQAHYISGDVGETATVQAINVRHGGGDTDKWAI